MDGQVVLVTGAASGIGLAAAQGFARLGARVLAVGRNPERAREAAQAISGAAAGAAVVPLACDLGDLAEVRALVAEVIDTEPRLDVLVNNAGVMPPSRTRSADGHELMFATHVLAPFALIAWLSDLLVSSAPARVINVSSGGMYTSSFSADDLQSDRERYSPARLYARTKREQVVISEQWAQRLGDDGVTVTAMHPGWVDTGAIRDALPLFARLTAPIIRSSHAGADTIVWLGSSPAPATGGGGFWHDRRVRPTRYRLGAPAESEADRQRLWDHCQSAIALARA